MYVDLAGFARYARKRKEWISTQPVKTLPSSLYPWTLTDKAGAVTCWPVGGTELKPTVDFLFSETGPASGDKGPENPSVISGISSIECSCGGKNLLYYPLDALTKTIDGVTFTYNNDGSFSVSGTSTRNPVIYRIAYSTENQSVYSYLPAGTYTISGCPQGGSWSTYSLVMMDTDGFLKDNLGKSIIDYGSGITFTIDEPKRIFCMMRLGYAVGTNISNIVYKPQLELGSSITALESANRSKLPLPLGNTYYGGEIDLATGLMTVTWGYKILDGTEDVYLNASLSSVNRFAVFKDFPIPIQQQACTHFNYLPSWESDTVHFYIPINTTGYVWIYSSEASAVDFKAWLSSQHSSGTPVVIVYKLAAPYTVQLSPTEILSLTQADKYTPRLNTIYTDASAVQVGYVKSPIREEYELTQAIVAQGGNI